MGKTVIKGGLSLKYKDFSVTTNSVGQWTVPNFTYGQPVTVFALAGEQLDNNNLLSGISRLRSSDNMLIGFTRFYSNSDLGVKTFTVRIFYY